MRFTALCISNSRSNARKRNKPKRSSDTLTSKAVQEGIQLRHDPYSVKVQTLSPQGFPITLEILKHNKAELVTELEALVVWLAQHGYKPRKEPCMPSPAFEVILGDCLEVLSQYPDKLLDALVTNPPFAMAGGLSNGRSSAGQWPVFSLLVAGRLRTTARVLKPRAKALSGVTGAQRHCWPGLYAQDTNP